MDWTCFSREQLSVEYTNLLFPKLYSKSKLVIHVFRGRRKNTPDQRNEESDWFEWMTVIRVKRKNTVKLYRQRNFRWCIVLKGIRGSTWPVSFTSGIEIKPKVHTLQLGHEELLQVGRTLVVLRATLVVWAAVENDAAKVGQKQPQAGIVARVNSLSHSCQI